MPARRAVRYSASSLMFEPVSVLRIARRTALVGRHAQQVTELAIDPPAVTGQKQRQPGQKQMVYSCT